MKVSDLSDAKLDMWVAKAEGRDVCPKEHIASRLHPEYCFKHKKPICENYSRDWSQGGPIITDNNISIIKEDQYNEYRAGFSPDIKYSPFLLENQIVMKHDQFGPTPLIAAMRSFVASKFGEEVDE